MPKIDLPHVRTSIRSRLAASSYSTTKQGSIGAGVVYDSNELLRLFEGLRIVRYEDVDAEADFGPRGQVTRAVRLAAQRP